MVKEMIECKLLPLEKNRYHNDNPPYKKYGHYMSSFYPLRGYGQTCWVVVANISVDYDHYTERGLSLEDIARQCIEYLNHRPKSKYGKKRRRKATYGVFRPTPHKVKLLDKGGKKYVQVLLVTEDRTNPNFWGEGNKGEYSCRRTKRRIP